MVKASEQDEWTIKAKNILRAEMKRHGMTYGELADKLGYTEKNLNNKISRGGFSAAFFLQCLEAIGTREVLLR